MPRQWTRMTMGNDLFSHISETFLPYMNALKEFFSSCYINPESSNKRADACKVLTWLSGFDTMKNAVIVMFAKEVALSVHVGAIGESAHRDFQ